MRFKKAYYASNSPPRGFFDKIPIMRKFTTYVQEAVAELHQVRWPTRQQAIRLSIIVIIFTACVSVAFGAIDYVLSLIVKLLLSLTY